MNVPTKHTKRGDELNITVNVDFNNMNLENFSELEKNIYRIGLQVSREITKRILEERDDQLVAERDKNRYRLKGKPKTTIKTLYGEVEFCRRVYEDRAAPEKLHYIHLLDQELNLDKVGLASPNLCTIIANSVCESTYESTARQISSLTGQSISKQGVWNITQKLGEKQQKLVERHQELSESGNGVGCISTEILYEENDGVWLSLQGKSRKENGPSKEMKVGIAYDGATWEIGKGGEKRRTLDNKVAYAGFVPAKTFKKNKEGMIASRFSVKDITLRVINGDGANWIQKHPGVKCISVLDEYHRNKKITECVRDPEFAATLRSLLFENRFEDILNCIEAQINSIEDETEKDNLFELYSYYSNNKKALAKYYDRGIEIPPTRDPGVVHHARLGSMESNIFSLISGRMKHGRKCWSINGANNLALLLCAKRTTGLDYLFSPLPDLPEKDSEWVDTEPLSHYIPKDDGDGYNYPHDCSTTNQPYWLRDISHFHSLSEIWFPN